MLKEGIILLVALILSVVALPIILAPQEGLIVSGSTSCFQDNANESDGCGLETGEYDVEIWDVTEPDNSFDTDWDTNSTDLCQIVGQNSFLVNYEIPENATSAIWQLKYRLYGDPVTVNYTLSGNCFEFNGIDNDYYVLVATSYMDEEDQCALAIGCYLEEGFHWFIGNPPD